MGYKINTKAYCKRNIFQKTVKLYLLNEINTSFYPHKSNASRIELSDDGFQFMLLNISRTAVI
jgi:hypothetical protein